MGEDERQPTDEEQKEELVAHLVDVRKRHVRFERGIWWPRFTTIVLDTDVSIPAYGIVIHAGEYHMLTPEGTVPECLTEEHEYLWKVELNGQSAIAMADMVTDHMQGKNPLDRYRVEGERTELKINIDLRRVDLAEGRPLHFEELLTWIAIAEAERDKDKDRARRIFELVYKSSPTEQDSGRTARGNTFQARERAERSGAIMSIGSRLTAFTTEQLKTSFTPRYIVEMPNGIDAHGDGVFDESGKFDENLLNEHDKVLVLDTVQEALLGAVTSLVSDRIKTDDQTNEVSFYLPEIMRELGIDPRGHFKKRGNETGELVRQRYEKMMQLIAPFDRYIGIMPDGSGIYRVLAFSGYDIESETMKISTPYIYELMRRAQQGDKAYKHRYLHGSVINEKSDAAVEVANAIICGVVRRGTLTDKSQGRRNVTDERRVSYDRTYASLIEDCPILKTKLESVERGTFKNKNQAYNNALKYTFQSAFRIIAEKSDLPKKYVDLHLPTKMETVRGERRQGYGYPTKSTLRQRMDIWHHGRAPKADVG